MKYLFLTFFLISAYCAEAAFLPGDLPKPPIIVGMPDKGCD